MTAISLAPSLNAATAGRGLPIGEYFHLAQRQGYEWVELDRVQAIALGELGVSAGQDLLCATGTRIASFFLPIQWSGDQLDFNNGLQKFRSMLPVLQHLGAVRCCTWLMPNYPTPPAETHRWITDRLREVALVLKGEGLKFGLEFVGPAHLRQEPGFTFIYRMEDMLEFSISLGTNVGVLVDSLHWHCTGASEQDLYAIPGDRLIYVHIDDAPEGPRDAVRDDGRLLPGDGAIDFCGFLRGISVAGYAGPVGIEVDGPALQHLPPDTAAAQARNSWQRVIARCQESAGR